MPFVGRAHQLAIVEAALASADERGATLVVVEGEAGIGKTALLEEAVRRWHRVGGRAVRRAKADELASSSPFRTLAAAFDLPPGESSLAALVERASTLVTSAPLALVVDDAQWLDAASTLALGRLLAELADHAFVVALSARPFPHPAELAALVTGPARRTHLVLPPMPIEELEAVVAGSGSWSGPDLPPLPLDQVGGNPLYALELAAATAAESTAAGALAPPLSVTILRRLSYLGDATVGVLRRAALLGSAFTLDDLILVADVAAPAVLDAVEVATRAGALRPEGTGLRFSHDLVRQALSDDVPDAVRRYEHGRIGRTLAEAGCPAEVVAAHLERAALRGDAEAIRWLERAAREVAPRSSEAAIDLLRRAVALEPADRDVRARMVANISVLLGHAGRYDEVLALAPAELAADPPGDAAVAMTTSLAQALAGRGRAAEACRILEERAVGASAAHRARLVGSLASMRLTNGEAEAARRAAAEALEAAVASGDDHWLHSTLAVQAWLAVGEGDADAGIELARRSVPPGVDDTDPAQAVFGRVPLGVALLEADRFEEASSEFRRAVEVGDRAGVSGNVTLAHVGLALVDYARGRMDEAVAGAETALALAKAGGNPSGDLYALALLARIALHRVGAGGAAPLVEAARSRLDQTGPVLGAEAVLWVGALMDEAAGRDVDVDLPLLAWQLHPLRYLLTWRLIAPDLVRWLVAAGRDEDATQIVADVEVVHPVSPGRRAIGARCRATLAAAVPGPEVLASPRPVEVASAHVASARAHLVSRDGDGRTAALASLKAGLAAWSAMGATADAETVLDLARRARLRVEAPLRTAGPSDALTPAERAVAALAADGLTNRAIGAQLAMSRHTVDTHLRHVYRKLGVSNRVELARRRFGAD